MDSANGFVTLERFYHYGYPSSSSDDEGGDGQCLVSFTISVVGLHEVLRCDLGTCASLSPLGHLPSQLGIAILILR